MMAVKEEKSVNELREFILGVPLRKTIIDAIAKDIKMQKETCDFLKLLIDTNRMDAIEDIINVFDEKYNILTDTQVRVLSPLNLRFMWLCYSLCTIITVIFALQEVNLGSFDMLK
jgi:F0F1-type ATP synthase delta subunit